MDTFLHFFKLNLTLYIYFIHNKYVQAGVFNLCYYYIYFFLIQTELFMKTRFLLYFVKICIYIVFINAYEIRVIDNTVAIYS